MKKKILFIITFLAMFVICSVGLFACNQNEEPTPGHTHTYSSEWTYDDTYHWHVATCEHTTEIKDKAEHNFVNGVCSICCKKENSKGLSYTLINGDTEYAVSGIGSCKDINIVIPSIYNDKPVTTIGEYAFYRCSSLTSIEIPNSVTTIGGGAFDDCFSLQYNEYDNGLYLGNSENKYLVLVKAKNESITSCVINDNCKIICYSAFDHCSSLTSVTIGNSVTTIEEWAFYECRSLTNVTIPDSVVTISPYAFFFCLNLQSLTIGNSVTTIGNSAFDHCSSLQSITVDENNNNYKSINGNLYSKDGKTLIQYSIGKKDTIFEIPNSVTTIGYSAFSGCSSLTSVMIPDSVTTIGSSAFDHCSSLESVTIPDSVTTIGEEAFFGCLKLQYNEYDNGLYLGSSDNKYLILVSAKDTSINSCIINDNCKFIHSDAFEYCSSLTSVTIGNSVTTIDEYAFYDCDSLTTVTIPDSVTTIGVYAFHNCSSLQSITFSDYSNWYITNNKTNWQDKTGGELTDLSNPTQNATYFKSTYDDYYWYKK